MAFSFPKDFQTPHHGRISSSPNALHGPQIPGVVEASVPMFGHDSMIADFQSGFGITSSHLARCAGEGPDFAVDSVVTLKLSGIAENDNDPHFWARILGSSDRLERLIVSRLRYLGKKGTRVGPAIPVRTHLRSLVLGNGNGRGFFLYMIRELKAPALLSLDLSLPNCSGWYGSGIISMLMAFFRSSPLIQNLTICIDGYVAIKILNVLHSPPTEEAPASSGNILLPHLRCLDFRVLNSCGDDALLMFCDELESFLISRPKVHWYDARPGRWQQKGDSKVLECLKVDRFLSLGASDRVKDYDQNIVRIPDEKPTPYRFHELDERWSDDEADSTWDSDGHVWDDESDFEED
ncbi:hypothetical protein BS47DRAFT_1389203 [Hydnum rufescens UP504]|uniref:Uncharacterized protein n=1 Tax=Hydnum rufescens UP504 TaxID=1448309 RepID=A0A9P6B7D3_9AGAM|nr:hypothetical protein BS47DRAFT_1389203 [Hydnum rufescens UP504]